MHVTALGPHRSSRGRIRRVRAALAVVLAVVGFSWGVAGQRLDKPRQAWLSVHRLLATPDEIQVLRRLSDPADLAVFERIFWARRSPDPAAATFRSAIEKARAIADARYSDTLRRGAETGCGQVFILLGNPDETSGREIRTTFDRRGAGNPTREGARRPETWVYKSNPARTFRMPGGDLRLQFDDGCEFDEAGRTMDELARVAALRVVHPELGYEFTSAGRLRPLGALPAPSAARPSLVDQARTDFPLTFDVSLRVPGAGGGYSAGILRGGPGSLLPGQIDASRSIALHVEARAVPAAGPVIDIPAREIQAVAEADGSFLTSYGLLLPPGRYDLKVAVREPGGRLASALSPLEVPDYASGALVAGPLMVFAGDPGLVVPPGVDPYAAFITAGEHLFPRLGNVLAPSDALRLIVLVHGGKLDAGTGKASLRARFTVSKDGTLVARGSEQAFATAAAAPSVGPIALAPFSPGRYLARVEIDDDVAGTRLSREAAFEVKAPEPPGGEP
jgi:GWxTD domain-containing protein